MHFFRGMFDFQSDYPLFSNLPLEIRDWIIIIAGLVIVYLIEFREEQGSGSLKEYIAARPVMRWIVYAAAIVLLIILGSDADAGFIYTQF